MLSIDDMISIKWYVDASSAVHPDFKSHIGVIMMWVTGTTKSGSTKQKLNTISRMESEVVGVENMVSMILWTKLFIEDQGYKVENNIFYQDNKSSILLETNGHKISGTRSQEMNICYVFITNQSEKGNVEIENFLTDGMVADFMTKPLQGSNF